MSQPAEDAIEAFMAVTNASRTHAINFLKSNKLDSNLAINAYYENPDAGNVQSDDWQQVSSYRPSLPTQETDLKNDLQPQATASEQPREAHSQAQTTGIVAKSPVTSPDNDGRLPAANTTRNTSSWALTVPANSDGWTAPLPPHRSQVYPQTPRVRRGSDARRLLYQEERRLTRQEGAPVGIRPLFSQYGVNYLPGYLTILHAIPIARKALLAADPDQQPVGGTSLQSRDATNLLKMLLSETRLLMAKLSHSTRAFVSLGRLEDSATPSSSALTVEHFLDTWVEAAFPIFVKKLTDIDAETIPSLFSSSAIRAFTASDRNSERQQREIQRNLSVIDCEMLPADNNSLFLPNVHEPQNLYDILDHTIWPDDYISSARLPADDGLDFDETYIENPAHIFNVRVQAQSSQNGGKCGIMAPVTLYLDRYLAKNRDWALEFRKKRESVAKQVAILDGISRRYMGNRGNRGAEPRVTSQILQDAVRASLIIAGQKEDNDDDNNDNAATNITREDTRRTAQQLAGDLSSLSSRVDEKVRSLEERRTFLTEALKRQAQQLSPQTPANGDQPDTSSFTPRAKYYLHGVCMPPHTTYVLRRARSDLEGSNEQDTHTTQWWCISFNLDAVSANQSVPQPWNPDQTTSTYAAPPWWAPPPPDDSDEDDHRKNKSRPTEGVYWAQRVQEADVMNAVYQGASDSMLLVYASEEVMSTKYGTGEDDPELLSEDLKKLVDLYDQQHPQNQQARARRDGRQSWETPPSSNEHSPGDKLELFHSPGFEQQDINMGGNVDGMDIGIGNEHYYGVNSWPKGDLISFADEQQSSMMDDDTFMDESRPASTSSIAVQRSPTRQEFDSWHQSTEEIDRDRSPVRGDVGDDESALQKDVEMEEAGDMEAKQSRGIDEGRNQEEEQRLEENKEKQSEKENRERKQGLGLGQGSERNCEARSDDCNGIGNDNGNNDDNGNSNTRDLEDGHDAKDPKDKDHDHAGGSARSLGRKILRKLL